MILHSPSLPLRPASSAESCSVGRLYPLSHFSAFRINWSWQPVAPTGIWQRLSNRRGDCHVYAAGCPRRACAFCLAVLDSATPERLLTCLRTPSRTSQKSWLDGQARARMAGSVIWTFPVGCGDPWKVSEQVSWQVWSRPSRQVDPVSGGFTSSLVYTPSVREINLSEGPWEGFFTEILAWVLLSA